MGHARSLFEINPKKFTSVAKGKTYEEFIAYLMAQPNFQIIQYLVEYDRRDLYEMSVKGE